MISIFPEMARSPSDVVGLGYPIIDKWCTKAVLSATLNGSYTAEFTIPHKAKGVKRELLPDVKQVIKLIDMDGDEEYFRVRRFKHNLKETVITAEHISYDLIDNLIEDINNVDKDGQGIMDKISAGTQYKHPFRLTSDILKTANIRMVRMNPIQALIGTADNTFVNRLGGELKRKQFTLAMNESIGIHRTDVIRSRRNLTGFEREINLEDYATRIMPRAKNGIELPEKYVDSPHIDPDHPVIKVIDYSDVEYDGEFKDLSDSDKNRVYNELRACAKADFAAGRDVPNASYEVDFITLRNTVEYADYRALENYNLGDTVSIYEADYDVEIEAKVISFEWDVLKKRYTSMKLGSFKNGIVRSNFNKTNSVDAKISQAQSTADIALLSADGKTTNFYGTGEPVNPKKGDTWFKKNGSEEEVWQYQEVDGVMMWVYVTGTRYANALKESIAHDFSEVTQQITEQQQAHDRTVAEILAQVDSTQSLAEQAKAIGDQAKADAVNLASQLSTAKTALQSSINDTKSQIATVSQALSTAKSDLQTQVNAADAKAVQAQTDVDGLKVKAETIKNDLNTAKTDLQTQVNAADAKAVQAQRDITQAKSDLQNQASQLITQAAKQVELTKLTTETKKLADSTLTSLNELTKTVDKATGNITSVTNRTKTVEDSLASVKTNYTQLNQTVNAQTGQIDSINRKTADLQSGIDSVTERFENLRVGGRNYISDYGFEESHIFYANTSAWKYERIADATARSGYHIKATCTQAGGLGFHKALRDLRGAEWQGRTMTYAVDIKASKSVRMRLGVEAFESGYKTIDVTTEWQRFVFTDIVNYRTSYSFAFYTNSVTWAVGDVVYIRDPQLEDGNVATTPHAAEEDFSNQIAEYKRTAEQNYSGLQSTISTLDGKVTQNKTEANQTATQLSNRLTSLETYKNAEGTRAQAYFEASKTETAKQITAERSVVAQNYTAKSTYTEDVTSIRRTISETKTELGSVTNRTKVVEDDLSGTKTKLEQVKTTADTTSRKTAELQSGLDGVTERFENLRVGGRNYISDYGFKESHIFYANTSAWKYERIADATARSGYHIKATCTQAGGGGFHKVLRDLRGAEWQGRTMTYAVDIKASKSVRMRLGVEAFKSDYKTIDVTTEWQRFVSTDTVNYRTYYSFTFYTDSVAWAVGDIIYIRDPQLEDGNVVTTPHAAEEDFSSQIAEYKRTSDQNYSGLQSTVQTLDGKITQNKTEANQTATQLSNRLTSLETYKNAEGTRAQFYFEAAKTETAKQITAERTAISQNYVAKSTYTEDYNGVTRRLTATETVANNTTTRLATYQNTNDRRVAALESNKISTDGTLTQLSNKVEQNAQQTRETISEIKSNLIIDGANSNLWIQSRTTGGFITEALPANHVTGQRMCYKLTNNTEITFNIEPDFSDRLYRKVTFSAWVKYENVVQGDNNWNKFNCFKHVLFRKNSKAGTVSTTDYLTLAGFEGTSDWKRITYTYDYSANTSYNQLKTSIKFNVESVRSGTAWVTGIKIELGDKATPYNLATEDVTNEISNAKLDITKTAEGLKVVADKSNANGNMLTQHTTQITALNNELSAKVSKTDYNTLTGRMTSAETTIQAHAGEISKRLTSTQVESAITSKGYQTASQVNATVTSKGYQTKSDVDSNITGRGYITSSALQPYATTTVLENKVKETSDSFNRTISAVRLEIPTSTSMRNLILKSSDKWGAYTSTDNANSNWCSEICRITLDSDRGISVGKKLNLFVYISADNVTLDSSSNHRMAIQALIKKKDGTNIWHADVPFHGQWSQNLKAGNNYYVIKLTKEIKATAYENGATLIVQCRIDGANHVDFHHRAAMITTGDMFPDAWSPAIEDLATVTALHDVKDTVSSHTRTIGAVGTAGSILDNISKVTQTAAGLVQEVSGTNGLKTQVSTLAGSYAIKNLTKAGDVLGQLNLNPDGSVRINEGLISIGDKTYIKNGVIKSAMIGNGQIGTAHIGEIDAGIAKIINLDVSNIKGLDAEFIKAKIENAFIGWMKGKTITAQNGNMIIDLLNGMITMRNSGKFVVDGGYAEFARQEGLVKASLAFHDSASTKNGIKLSVDDGLGKSTSIKSIWLNERKCYISDFDEISLHTASGNGIRITKDALEFTVDGNNYIWGKTTFDKISKL
ncbi:TPA: phage tail spike protein [Streptococcus suis]